MVGSVMSTFVIDHRDDVRFIKQVTSLNSDVRFFPGAPYVQLRHLEEVLDL